MDKELSQFPFMISCGAKYDSVYAISEITDRAKAFKPA